MGEDPDAIERQIGRTRERIGERIDALSYKADVKGRVGDSLTEKRDQVTGRVSEFFSGTSERASDVTDRTPSAENVKHQTRRAAGLVRENPLGLAVGAAAAGFLVGLILPSTRMEDEQLGEAADTVKARAAEAGQEALSRGQQVAQDVGQTAAQTARESGSQQADEFADSARQRASEAAAEARSKTEQR